MCLSATSPAGTYTVSTAGSTFAPGGSHTIIASTNLSPGGPCVAVFTRTAPLTPGSPGIPTADPVPSYIKVAFTAVPAGVILDVDGVDCVLDAGVEPPLDCTEPDASPAVVDATISARFFHGTKVTFSFVTAPVTPPPPPCPPSSIASNFNGTAIPAGRTIWFNATAKVSGPVTGTTVIEFKGSTVRFTAVGIPYVVTGPSARIAYSAAAALPTTVYNGGTNTWVTTLPLSYTQNFFLAGSSLVSPGLRGGINPVTWYGSFTSTTAGLRIQWKWGAAVYTSFGAPGAYGALGVNQSGTPTSFKNFVTGGARGGGGSNFTGSWSATKNAGICPASNGGPIGD